MWHDLACLKLTSSYRTNECLNNTHRTTAYDGKTHADADNVLMFVHLSAMCHQHKLSGLLAQSTHITCSSAYHVHTYSLTNTRNICIYTHQNGCNKVPRIQTGNLDISGCRSIKRTQEQDRLHILRPDNKTCMCQDPKVLTAH